MNKRKKIGEILVEQGILKLEHLNEALLEQKKTGGKIGKILVKNGIISEQQLLETLEFVLGIPHVQLSKLAIDPEVVHLISPSLIRMHKILPINRNKQSLTLAMSDPLNQQAIDDVRMATGLDIVPVVTSEKELDTTIRQYLAFRLDPQVERILQELDKESESSIINQRNFQSIRVDDDAPIIRIINSIITQAVDGHCSDIHFEPQTEHLRVRFRVDGELYEVINLPKNYLGAVVSRLKIIASLDIAEKRVPQDGRFRMNIHNREVDFRVSTLPASNGEKVVLRILDRGSGITRVDQLGLSSENQMKVLALAKRPYGMVLVTGPTGSGKTTTLYAMLNEINSVDKNIITLEDPVEYILDGINQVQMNPKAGLTFASGLRSILRQDPDIIMVGEIRDTETARLAIQAAMTGHLVLSTLHTNSAAGTIARLSDMGLESFLLASSLAGVISQRLVRKLCPHCRSEYQLDKESAVKLGIPEETGHIFYQAVGCNMCRQLGYIGRIAIHEVLMVGQHLRSMIGHGDNIEGVLEKAALQEGMKSIKLDGIMKCKQGKTTIEEIMKVVLLGG